MRMPPFDLMIDEAGRSYATGSGELLRSLHIERRNFDLTQYLIRNMGFVRFRRMRGDARITLYPRFLTRAAYESLALLIVDQECTRHILEHVEDPGRMEIVPGMEDTIARLGDLASAGGEVVRADFYNEELSLRRLHGTRRLAPLARLMRRWKAHQGSAPVQLDRLFADPALRGRAMMVRMLNDERGVVEYAGEGFSCFDSGWHRSVIGRDIWEQPDPSYGHLVAEAYAKTYRSNEPRLEFVEAAIRTPGCPLRRSRYERLLLPWRSRGASFVSAVSVLRTSFSTDWAM
jgi:hypothetical protein